MEQYPDSIVIKVVTAATQDEETGLWTEGTTTIYTLDCRAEMNGTGRKIPGNDGSLIDFAYTIYLPQMTTVIPRDSEYTLNGTITGKVKGASNGQLNSRIWL